MNRDTLYSGAIVDISAGATLTIPDTGRRYVSVMIVNQDHYVNHVFHEPGEHELTVEQFGTPYVVAAARMLVDPADPGDVAAGNALQDQLGLKAGSALPFVPPDYDQASLIATAAGWGGLPDHEATYLSVSPGLPVGEYRLTVRDVPVDGFWSVSVYNAAGYFEPNDLGAYSLNNLTATPGADGSITICFGGRGDERPNCLPITDDWNYLVRLYRPRTEILNGTWAFPALGPDTG